MSEEIKINEPLPPDVVDAVREAYAPPSDPGYWTGLESRIMSSLGRPAGRWWVVVGDWAHGSMIAAAAAIVAVVVGALLIHAHDAEMRVAYESATRPTVAESIAVPTGALSELDGPETRGATFRDVISH